MTVTRLKKAYSTLGQAFVSSVADNGNAENWVDTGTLITEENLREYFDLYWAPYLKVLKFCNSQSDCGYETNVKTYNGIISNLGFFGSKRISVLTTDGMYLFFRSISGSGSGVETFSKQQEIFVDINAGKGPNVYGKDIFLFVLDLNNAKINPYGHNLSDSVIDNKCYGSGAVNYATTCAAKIMRDGWQITYY